MQEQTNSDNNGNTKEGTVKKFYNEAAELIKESTYANNKLQKNKFYNNGKLIAIMDYNENEQIIKKQLYTIEGILIQNDKYELYDYKNNRIIDGSTEEYYSSTGNIKHQVYYTNGEIIVLFSYYENGKGMSDYDSELYFISTFEVSKEEIVKTHFDNFKREYGI